MKTGQKNKVHPEIRKGEVFFANASDYQLLIINFGDYTDNRSSWESIGWRTKRRGVIAYDIHDKPIKGVFPVFVQEEELIKAGLNPDTLWD